MEKFMEKIPRIIFQGYGEIVKRIKYKHHTILYVRSYSPSGNEKSKLKNGGVIENTDIYPLRVSSSLMKKQMLKGIMFEDGSKIFYKGMIQSKKISFEKPLKTTLTCWCFIQKLELMEIN